MLLFPFSSFIFLFFGIRNRRANIQWKNHDWIKGCGKREKDICTMMNEHFIDIVAKFFISHSLMKFMSVRGLFIYLFYNFPQKKKTKTKKYSFVVFIFNHHWVDFLMNGIEISSGHLYQLYNHANWTNEKKKSHASYKHHNHILITVCNFSSLFCGSFEITFFPKILMFGIRVRNKSEKKN